MNLRRVYETTFIVNAAIEDADIENVISKVSGYIENNGGEILEVSRWGRRRLAYPINKKFNGYYVHIIFESKPSLLPILERFLVLEDTVLRHLTLLLPKKLRDYRTRLAAETGRRYDQAFVDNDGNKAEQPKTDNRNRSGRYNGAGRYNAAPRYNDAPKVDAAEVAPEVADAVADAPVAEA